jgi:hypothetical protein
MWILFYGLNCSGFLRNYLVLIGILGPKLPLNMAIVSLPLVSRYLTRIHKIPYQKYWSIALFTRKQPNFSQSELH